MNNTVIDRIRILYKKECGSIPKFADILNISSDTLKNVVSRGVSPNYEILSAIAESFPDYSMDWLLTGQGEMYKTEYNAGRDNVGVGNKVEGDNKGVIGNTGTVGNVGGNHVSIADTSNIKKIMNEEGVSIEFAQSVDSLQQTNAHLEIRIKDLETINASQSKTIETMQLLIDTLSKK